MEDEDVVLRRELSYVSARRRRVPSTSRAMPSLALHKELLHSQLRTIAQRPDIPSIQCHVLLDWTTPGSRA
jgi:hypothetical protein